MTLKEKVTDLCKQNGISVRELERRAGLKERTIQHWDESEPSAAKVYAVANALNVPLEELLSVYHPEMEHLAYIESMKNKEKPATESDGLVKEPFSRWADKDARLLMWFRSLPPEKQKAILISQDAPEDLV